MTNSDFNIELLKGKTITSIDIDRENDEVILTIENGNKYKLYHDQNCCESVVINKICGDISKVINSPLINVKYKVLDNDPKWYKTDYDDSHTWTSFLFETENGGLEIIWLGESNGYYGEGVSVDEEVINPI